jgi:HPt (histidine-containing phosphotransfer) domain-containing protein
MNDFTVHRAANQSHSDVAPRRQIAEAPQPGKSSPGISAQKSKNLSPVACEAKPTSMSASTLPNSPKEAERVAEEAVSAFEAANDALPARLAEIDHPPGRQASPAYEKIRENKKREAEQDVRCLRLLAEAAAVNLRTIQKQEPMGADSLARAEGLVHRTTDLGIAERAQRKTTDALNKFGVAEKKLMKSIQDNLGEPDRDATQAAQQALADAKRAAHAELAAWQAAKASAQDSAVRDKCQNWIESAQSTIKTLESFN